MTPDGKFIVKIPLGLRGLKSIFLFRNMSSMVYKYLCQLSDLSS